MKDRFLIVLLCLANLFSSTGKAQKNWASENFERAYENRIRAKMISDYMSVKPYFEEAYALFGTIPKGFLESVAYQYTRFAQGVRLDDSKESPQSIPRTYSVMGLTYDGKGYFRDNLKLISKLSDVTESEIIQDDRKAILAYAAAFAQLQEKYYCFGDSVEKYKQIFIDLSELPLPDLSNPKVNGYSGDLSEQYALNSFLYVVYKFLSDSIFSCVGSPVYKVNFEDLFGADLKMLTSPNLNFYENDDTRLNRNQDYAAAVWNPAASCNYSSGRGGNTISNVTIHYTSGTYAGSIAWFKNCSAQVSAHYLIRSMDGQVTQMVRESDKAWHVGTANGYSIGIEHEAYGDVESFFTLPMYHSSANLVRDICSRYPNINPHHVFYRDTLDDGLVLNNGLHDLGGTSACTQIRGHQHFPSQTHTDPGPFWNWNYYYKLINPDTPMLLFTADTGTFTDSGGLMGDYGNNERELYHFHLTGADSIVLDFTTFSLEADYDFMWIYAGASVFSPTMGRWNTTTPGRIVVPGEDVLVEFRSDCTIAKSGWVARWHGCYPQTQPQDAEPPTTCILLDEDNWQTQDFVTAFEDSDDVALKYRFYQVMEKAGNVWTANPNCGFFCDNFDAELNTAIWHSTGNWQVMNHALQSCNTVSESFVSANLRGDCHDVYLYDFYMSLEQGQQASFYFACNQNLASGNVVSGYQVVFDKGERALKIFRIRNGVFAELKKLENIYYTNQQNYLYRIIWDRNNGEILVFRHANLLGGVQDSDFGCSIPTSIGFSAVNSIVRVDNIRVYGSRDNRAMITVGEGMDKMIREQSIAGNVVAKVKSIVLDSANRFSSLVEKNLKVDYSKPSAVHSIETQLSVKQNRIKWKLRWSSVEDANSGLKEYSYRVTADPNPNVTLLSNVNEWIPLCLDTQLTLPFAIEPKPTGMINVKPKLTETQKRNLVGVEIRAQNNAGLFSDSHYVTIPSRDLQSIANANDFNVYPNPCQSQFRIESKNRNENLKNMPLDECNVIVYDAAGHVLQEKSFFDTAMIDISSYPSGVYVVKVWKQNACVFVEKVLKASFSVSPIR